MSTTQQVTVHHKSLLQAHVTIKKKTRHVKTKIFRNTSQRLPGGKVTCEVSQCQWDVRRGWTPQSCSQALYLLWNLLASDEATSFYDCWSQHWQCVPMGHSEADKEIKRPIIANFFSETKMETILMGLMKSCSYK